MAARSKVSTLQTSQRRYHATPLHPDMLLQCGTIRNAIGSRVKGSEEAMHERHRPPRCSHRGAPGSAQRHPEAVMCPCIRLHSKPARRHVGAGSRRVAGAHHEPLHATVIMQPCTPASPSIAPHVRAKQQPPVLFLLNQPMNTARYH